MPSEVYRIIGSRIDQIKMNYSGDLDHQTKRLVSCLLFIYPILLLSVRDGASVCFVLLIVVSSCYFFMKDWRNIVGWSQGDIGFAVAMFGLIGAILVSDAFHRSFKLSSLDGASRFLFSIPIYSLLRQMPLAVPRSLEYGFPLGALAGLLTSIFFPSIHWAVGTYFVDSIRFGGASLALGFLSLATINWTRKDPPAMLALKLGGFSIGLYCAIHSAARGAWVSIPVILLILGYYKFEGKRRAKHVAAMVSVVIALASYQLVPQVRDRIAVTQSEFTSILTGHFDTSIGIRLQIWGAAIQLIRENPIAGVGPTGLPAALRAMHQSGAIDDCVLDLGIAETHNEILSHTVKLGVLGLLAILAIYLVPAILFAAATSSSDQIKRNAGVTGMLFVVTYFIFGLTVETFNIKTFATFYAMTVACLLAVARYSAPQAADRADPPCGRLETAFKASASGLR